MIVYVDPYIDSNDALPGIERAIREGINKRRLECRDENEELIIQFSSGVYHLMSAASIQTDYIAHDDGCGDIHDKEVHLLLKDMDHITLRGTFDKEGNPSTFLTGNNPGTISTLMPSIIWAENCKNLCVQGISFARNPESVYSGLIERVTKESIFVRLCNPDAAIRLSDTLGAYCMNAFIQKNSSPQYTLYGESMTIGFGYDHRFYRVENELYRLDDIAQARRVSQWIATLPSDQKMGLSFQQSGRTDFLLFFHGCDDLVLKQVDIRCANSFCILTQYCHNITANQVRIMPLQGLFHTGSRDGWKIYRSSGTILVDHCHFEGVRMDGQNVQSNYLKVEEICNEHEMICQCRYASIPLREGSHLEMAHNERQYWTIDAWESLPGFYEMPRQSSDPSAGLVVKDKANHISRYRIHTSEAINAILKEESLLEADCWRPDSYTCTNSTFRNIAGAGNLVRCRNVQISGNTYENLMCPAVVMGAELDTHCESGDAKHIRIFQNSITNTGYKGRYGNLACGAIAIKTQGENEIVNTDIVITENMITNCHVGMDIHNATNVTILHNQFCGVEIPVQIDSKNSKEVHID